MSISAFSNCNRFLHTWKQQKQQKSGMYSSSSSRHVPCVCFARMSGSDGDSRQFIQEDPHVYTYDSDRIQNAQTTYCTFDAESGAEKKGLTRRFVICRSATPDFPHKEKGFFCGGGSDESRAAAEVAIRVTEFANKFRKLRMLLLPELQNGAPRARTRMFFFRGQICAQCPCPIVCLIK